MDHFQASLELHQKHRGKLEVRSKVPLASRNDLSAAYSPGVARPCEVIAEDPSAALSLTCKGNMVAVLSDGSAVLGLGNIGPTAAIPVMEGKAVLFREFGKIDAVPVCVQVESDEELITVARAIAPTFAGINLEDIAAPRCFVIEAALQDLGIPVLHDDQHGTAIVLLAALRNAARVTNKAFSDLRVVINGSGAAGIAIAKLLGCQAAAGSACGAVADILVCDSRGIVSKERDGLNVYKQGLLTFTNHENRSGDLRDALRGADVFIGVSKGNLLTADDIRTMNPGAIILAMANPIPEIMPEEAAAGGAAVYGTGRSDFPNQVNNVLAFPGLFRGALDAQATRFTNEMKLAAAAALADAVATPVAEQILPNPLDHSVAQRVAAAVSKAVAAGG